jgi:GDP/UDP-N,N'-diacetylbacillosamine 2-epimerase (hydrolysing)
MIRRQVLAITAIRSEYYLQRAIFHAINEHPDLELTLIVTGAHLSPLHGYSVKTIEADGFHIAERIESLIFSDRDAARLKGAASQLQVLSHIVDARRPDWLLVPADREESMTLALCGAYMGLAMAHYGAGDRVVGNVDDMVRHAVSRLSHLLLTTHEDARQRLIQAGEQEWRVHNVGHSGLDRIARTPAMTDDELAQALGIEQIEKPYLVVIQHPLSSEFEAAGQQMRETLEAAKELELQTFVSYPNSDAGGRLVIEAIEEYRSHPKFHLFQNIPDAPFVNLLRGAAMLLGNSSLGLLEAPFLRLPVVNVGARQSARHHVENVFFVACDRRQIADKVRFILGSEEIRNRVANCSNPYGDGHTGERVANLLATTPIDAKLLNKDLSY